MKSLNSKQAKKQTGVKIEWNGFKMRERER